jgi:hypothetical protein
VLAAAGLTGCFGIAHTWVHVPPLEVHVGTAGQTTNSDIAVDVVRAEFYGNSQALVALVTDGVEDKYPPYERRTLRTSGTTTALTFAKEDRYVGFPLFIIAIPPSEETSRSPTVFFRVASSGVLHRVDVIGSKATARTAKLADARAKLPPVLKGVRPSPPDPQWRIWFDAETKFYESVEWQPSSGFSVIDVKRAPERDLLVVRIEPA